VTAARSERDGGSDPTGLVVVDKEEGWTSHDVVARCRRLFGQRRVGHAGTLDPDATGVLLVGLGRFTRMLRFLSPLDKSYIGEVVLGVSTSTLDASGEVTGRWDMTGVDLPAARLAAQALTGTLQQVPPMVSAIKVGGRRLHELARTGIEVDRAPRRVEVSRFDVSAGPEPGVLSIAVDCSSGTYVRSLAADLGVALGGGAHLRKLRRTRVGAFTADQARRLEELTPADVLSPARGLAHMPRVVVGADLVRSVAHGLALDRVAAGASGAGPWAVLDRRGRLLAVYRATETDRLAAVCVLASSG
jgi:tRNA pseudouridine55 synthase